MPAQIPIMHDPHENWNLSLLAQRIEHANLRTRKPVDFFCPWPTFGLDKLCEIWYTIED